MKNYFGYVRVSTVKQGEKGVSLQEQRNAIDTYAQRQGLAISAWYEEKETAAKKGRPVFTQMMRRLALGHVCGVIIHKIDRSARNLRDWADLGELIDKGVEVHFANESLDLNSRGGRLSADIQAVVAADFIRNLRDETRKGFYGRIKQGLFPLPAPIGYIDVGKGKPKEPDPKKAPLIRKAFELYGSGKHNLHTLEETMFTLGLRNRAGRKVTINGLSCILNNPFYIGLIRLKATGETFPGVHKPLIKAALFKRVHAILTGKTNSRPVKHEFLFRRRLTCSHCGYSLIGEKQKGISYYRCHTKNCPTSGVREDSIEQRVLDTLSRVQFNKHEIAYMRSKVDFLRENNQALHEDQIKAIELSLSGLKDKMDRLTDAYIDRMIEKSIFEDRKTSLLVEIKKHEDQLAELTRNPRAMTEELSKFLELAGSAYVSYKMGLPEEKKELLEIVTSNRFIDRKNVEVNLKNPFEQVANRCEMHYSTPYRDSPRTYLDRLLDELVKYFKDTDHKLQKTTALGDS